MIRLLAIALFANVALAQSQLYIDLSANWRFSGINTDTGPAMAQPEFDDRNWRLIDPALYQNGDENSGWLRRIVDLPDWTDRTQLAITLGPLRERYDVYVNGQRIARVGDPGTFSTAQFSQARTFPIPAAAVGSGNRLVIAICLARQAVTPPAWQPSGRRTPHLITYFSNAPWAAGVEGLALHRAKHTPTVGMSLIFFVLGIQILLAWLNERQRPELFWLAAFVLASCVYGAQVVMSISPESTPWNHQGAPWISQITRSATWMTLAAFVITAVGFRLVWLHMLLWLGWTVFVVLLAAGREEFSIYASLGLLASGSALAVVALAWRRLGKERAPFHRYLFLFLLLLNVLDKLRLTARLFLGLSPGLDLQYVAAGSYLVSPADLFTLILVDAMLILLLRQVAADQRDRLRLSAEMGAARTAQQFLLGDGATIHTANFEIEPVYEPALEVGGDFHWTRIEPGGELIAVVGDVSGKGLKAAMLVSVAIGILRNEKSESPVAILGALNNGLVGHTGGGFVTCCCARFATDGITAIANAGHLSPYVDGRELEIEAGLPLGIVGGVEYQETTTRGKRFTFVSDGVVEASNASGELFGFERTREISGKPASEIADAAKAWGQNDDITVVTVRRHG